VIPAARFARIRRNPSLFPGVAESLGPGFAWHTHAANPRSSQALCLSAWVPLAGSDTRHAVLDALVDEWLPELGPGSEPAPDSGLRSAPGSGAGRRRWRVSVEVSDPDVLGERGARASAIDVVLEAADTVVCVESKFLGDAAAGFRGCSQFPQACRGFYGPGSDRAGGTDASCRLAVRDGRREARRYWDVAAGLFRPEALAPGPGDPGSCPLHRSCQLARTLLYARVLAGPAAAGRATASAGRTGPAAAEGRPAARRRFAALVIAPQATAGVLERQTAAFAAGVLLPEHAGRVAVAHYEGLVRLLQDCGDARAQAVGAFVAGLLPAAGPPPASAPRPAREQTARELRRRAEARRRARRHGSPAAGQDDAGEPRTMSS